MSKFLKFRVDLDGFIEELKSKIEQNNAKVDTLLEIENKTFANFVKQLEMMDEHLNQFFTPLSHLNSVNNSDKTQEIYAESLPIITEYSTKLSQNIEIYKAYKEIQKSEEKNLNQEQKRVLELNILHFELSGAHLDEKTKARLQEINIKKSELSNNFSQNVLNATNEYEYIITDEKDIEGIPQSDILNAKFEENGTTKYRFTLQMPSYIAYMTYGKNEKIREELYRAYVTRAPQNAQIIDELLLLKNEMSNLLGFDNYASYSLASKMAKDEKSVLDFLEKLLINSKEQAKEELQEVQKLSSKSLQSFDSAYYGELLKKEKYEIDEEIYRPYFEQKKVVEGMFEFLNKLFGVKFKRTDEKLWHEKAYSCDLYIDDMLKSRLYLDLETRKGKQGGAWMNNFQTHCKDEKADEQLSSAVIVCNFPPSTDKNPSLLRHDDVVTLFHEMGHAIHHMLSNVNENEVSGVNGVEWDAVEFPSQFLENFAYEPHVLKLFASHYETAEIIPDEMIEKLVRSKNFLSASGMLRQLEFSIFDFKLHTKVYQKDEVQSLLDSIREETALIKPPSYNKFQNGFSHIFSGGYAAGYYSYKWAEVLSADAFFSVVDEGIFGSETAKRYLHVVLQGGGSQSMGVLFKELMGREANPEYLLRLNGIK
ncbi:MAG: peptidase M3 [Sulfurimonas sp. RIFOXYD12_FULL_33_39]|uniref:M3 family metallopeptidase n=1 Tax=unclassified Sulfurimonas TaxID=2623549 RepID=UPI0008D65E39|nr:MULTISPECIES: M3 family metallopeptidase [unclassified Sulfurimonas]OHE10206.1 MAG: peptidase M3 [Sulfurimonas sp. RIFOXYD12_FULL_33_39]OHE14573.1 MAG: peptidase M3 [Sulfurimonas sp. RIFOXYD2_FULL_34_21]DAB28338.1 MAG TPA: peptidase M3 [Sulfurimonas sp. UBA10385]